MSKLEVSIWSIDRLEKLPGSWPVGSLRSVLDELDCSLDDDATNEEVWDFCLLALADLDPNIAAKLLLGKVLGKRLTVGQINNLSQEMLEEKMWEEYPDMSLHRQIYEINYLLFEAFNGKFPKPTAEKLSLLITKDPSPEVLALLRLGDRIPYMQIMLGALMENALVHRMFGDSIGKQKYDDPSLIIWQNALIEGVDERKIEIISSTYWFDDLLDQAIYTVDLTSALDRKNLQYSLS